MARTHALLDWERAWDDGQVAPVLASLADYFGGIERSSRRIAGPHGNT